MGSASIALLRTVAGFYRVPPFLLPIYQAAGAAYGIRWQVLAAINEIETDYGLNLSVSSAGAEGWMQFEPSTWARYGLDVAGSGVADPYNPVDAIFSAARYLDAAGAATDLTGAIYAYNHANWYVQSVLLRARLLELEPTVLTNGLAGLMQARFPVAGPLGPLAAVVPRPVATRRGPAAVIAAPGSAPVIASADGRVVAIGRNHRDGWYIVLEDQFGNLFRYSHLGSVRSVYPVLAPSSSPSAAELPARGRRPSPAERGTAILAGRVRTPSETGSGKPPSSERRGAPVTSQVARLASTEDSRSVPGFGSRSASVEPAKVRLFAFPYRSASWAAGGDLQVQIGPLSDYFSEPLRLPGRDYVLQPLRAGVSVAEGTIVGATGGHPGARSSIIFAVRPAGPHEEWIDPRPVVQGWELLGASLAPEGDHADLGAAPQTGAATVRSPVPPAVRFGRLLLGPTDQLALAVLTDPRIEIGRCGRRAIEAGLVDRRVLETLAYLSYAQLDVSVSSLDCARRVVGGAHGSTVDELAVSDQQRSGEAAGIYTAELVRALLSLRGILAPTNIATGANVARAPNVRALACCRGQIIFSYGARLDVPRPAARRSAPGEPDRPAAGMTAQTWNTLIGRLDSLPMAALLGPIPPSSDIRDLGSPKPPT